MSSKGTPRISLQRPALAILVAGMLLLGAGGPALAASQLGSKPCVAVGSNVTELGSKPSIIKRGNVITLGAKADIACGTSVIAPVDEEIPQPI